MYGALDEVHLCASSEGAAHVGRVHGHVVLVNAGDLRPVFRRLYRRLVARPDVELAIAKVSHGVNRLHRRVREVGHLVFTVDLDALNQRLVYVSVVAELAVRFIGEGTFHNVEMTLGRRRVRAGIPVEADGIGRPDGVPGVGRDNGDATLERNDLSNARHVLRVRRVVGIHASPEHRIHLDRCEKHVGQADIDGVGRRTGALGRHVNAWLRLAEQAPLRSRSELRVRRWFDVGGQRGELRVGDAPSILALDVSAAGLQRVSVCAQLFRRRLDKHLTGRCARFAHFNETIRRRCRTPGHLQRQELRREVRKCADALGRLAVVNRRERDAFLEQHAVEIGFGCRPVFNVDRIEFDVEFFGHHRRERRVDALAHLGPRGDNCDPLLVDTHVRRQRRLARLQTVEQRIRIVGLVAPVSEHNATGNGGRADQEGSARDRPRPTHPVVPSSQRL